MKKKLVKSNKNVILADILAGTGEYIGIDSIAVRVLHVFLSLVALGNLIILYVLLVSIIPSARSTRTNYRHNNTHYGKDNYREQTKKHREAEKIDDDEWSDS